jgi:uncharacterized membrane protein YfcA
MTAVDLLLGFAAGLLVMVLTAPVGVSGAVFLLPFHVSVLQVPSPAVTPTNLLFNVVATPGPLLRYHRQGQLAGPLLRPLLAGTLPGVVIGAALRVHLIAGQRLFLTLVGAAARREARPVVIGLLAFVAGVIGGVYGIGGGSILGPILVGWGLPIAAVAPAALASTFAASVVGTLAYAGLALTTPGSVAPYWALGLACGLGGLIGGYLGARLQPYLPARLLMLLLGAVSAALGVLYLIRSI